MDILRWELTLSKKFFISCVSRETNIMFLRGKIFSYKGANSSLLAHSPAHPPPIFKGAWRHKSCLPLKKMVETLPDVSVSPKYQQTAFVFSSHVKAHSHTGVGTAIIVSVGVTRNICITVLILDLKTKLVIMPFWMEHILSHGMDFRRYSWILYLILQWTYVVDIC